MFPFEEVEEVEEVEGLEIGVLDFYASGWVFVKKYDFNKLSTHEKDKYNENGIVTSELNDEWLALATVNFKEKIPGNIVKIANLNNLNSFIFAFIKIDEVKNTEFSMLWNKYKK